MNVWVIIALLILITPAIIFFKMRSKPQYLTKEQVLGILGNPSEIEDVKATTGPVIVKCPSLGERELQKAEMEGSRSAYVRKVTFQTNLEFDTLSNGQIIAFAHKNELIVGTVSFYIPPFKPGNNFIYVFDDDLKRYKIPNPKTSCYISNVYKLKNFP